MITDDQKQLYPALNDGEWEDLGFHSYGLIWYRQLLETIDDRSKIYIGLVVIPNNFHYCWQMRSRGCGRGDRIATDDFEQAKQIAIEEGRKSFEELQERWRALAHA